MGIELLCERRDDAFEQKSIESDIRNLCIELGLSASVALAEYKYDKRPLRDLPSDERGGVIGNSWKLGFDDQAFVQDSISRIPRTVHFDSVALPRLDLKQLHMHTVDFNRRSYIEWSLHFLLPDQSSVQQWADRELTAFAVIEKIVHRGRRTVLSLSLEQRISGCISNPSALKDAVALAHQFQASIIELVKNRKIDGPCQISVGAGSESFNPGELLNESLSDLIYLADCVCELYGADNLFKEIEAVSLSGRVPDKPLLVFMIEDGIHPFSLDDFEENELLLQNQAGVEEYSFAFTKVRKRVSVSLDELQLRRGLGVGYGASEDAHAHRTSDPLPALLKYIFDFEGFRPNQIDGVIRGLLKQDSIVLLPTGSGKSVIYQLLSLITPGVSFVVDPLISLIEDQVANLYARGIDRVVGISSDVGLDDKNRLTQSIGQGDYLLSFVAPERFQIRSFLDKVARYSMTNVVSVIAIDEAHCVSEWGHSFRIAYLGLADTCREICATNGESPPLLALTGTASQSVLEDIQRDLGIMGDDSLVVPGSFDRQELRFRVLRAKPGRKHEVLSHVLSHMIPEDLSGYDPENPFPHDCECYELNGDETNSGLVFCVNVNGPYGLMVKKGRSGKGVYDVVKSVIPSCEVYAGKLPDRLGHLKKSWKQVKRENARRFKHNELTALVATKAFGMGIDKPNIRWIVHFGIPSSLEAYYQEAGRAGRDRNASYCYIILNNDYERENAEVLDARVTPIEQLGALDEKKKGKRKGDDISRLIFFHSDSFAGIDDELAACRNLLERRRDHWQADKRFHVPFSKDNSDSLEKTIYRLRLLGVYETYTVDYDRKEFVIKAATLDKEKVQSKYLAYIATYQNNERYLERMKQNLIGRTEGREGADFILGVVESLLRDFTYRVVEEGRRQAIKKMLDVATQASNIEDAAESELYFRQQLLNYFSVDRKVGLIQLIDNATDFPSAFDLAMKANDSKSTDALIGQVDRFLESYPEHVGYLFIRFVCSHRLGRFAQMVDSLQSFLYRGEVSYGCRRADLLAMTSKILDHVSNHAFERVDSEGWNVFLSSIEASDGLDGERLFGGVLIPELEYAIKVRSIHRMVKTMTQLEEKCQITA